MTRRRWWQAGILLVVGIAVAGIAVLAWTWRHPTAFPDAGGATTGARDWAAGRTLYAGMSIPGDAGDGQVEIDHAEPNVVTDTADAEVDAVLCTLVEDVGGIGAISEVDIDEFCSALVPAEGVTMSIGEDDHQQLLVSVTTTEPGLVEIEGLDVTYKHGWQHGTQRIGPDLRVRTRTSS